MTWFLLDGGPFERIRSDFRAQSLRPSWTMGPGPFAFATFLNGRAFQNQVLQTARDPSTFFVRERELPNRLAVAVTNDGLSDFDSVLKS